MINKFVFLTLIGLRLYAAPDITPAFTTTVPAPQVVEMKASWKANRIHLDWTVSHNEEAYLFQVEKSLDGRRFNMAGMVLGTDKPDAEQYSFYEPATDKRLYYRIRITDKNEENRLTRIVEIRKDRSVTLSNQ